MKQELTGYRLQVIDYRFQILNYKFFCHIAPCVGVADMRCGSGVNVRHLNTSKISARKFLP